MENIKRAVIGLFAFVAIFFVISSQSSSTNTYAIPAFARKYETSCMTCHTAFPKLNAFGEAFKRRGYRMPDDENMKKQKDVKLGSPAWKRVWPKSIWPGKIPGKAPIAFSIPFSVSAPQNSRLSKVDFAFPEGLQMLIGGTTGKTFSFYGDVEIGNNSINIGRLFAQANMKNHFFNVRIGQFDTAMVPFSGHRSLFLSDSILNSFSATPIRRHDEHDEKGSGNYDNNHGFVSILDVDDNDHGEDSNHINNFLSSGHHSSSGIGASQMGIEIYGFKENIFSRAIGFSYAFGVINGNGIGGGGHEAQGHGDGHGSFDDNGFKDYYGRASIKFGGMGMLGADKDREKATKNFFDVSPSLQLGFFASYGKSPFEHGEHEFENKSRKYGADAKFRTTFFELNAAYLKGKDEFLGRGIGHNFEPVVNYSSQYIEADAITPWPWIIPAFRYDRVVINGLGSVTRYTPHVTILLQANVKTVFEYQTVRGIPNMNGIKTSLIIAF